MSSVLPTSRKRRLRLPLILSCWIALTVGLSEAAMAAEDLYSNLAVAQEAIKDDDCDRAEKILEKILITEKNNAIALRLMGTIFLKRGLRADAIAEFTTALQIDPQDELTREYLFSIYYNRAQELLGNPQETFQARGELEKAIAIRPGGIMSYYFLGTLNYQEKRDAECITTLLKVADNIPEKLRPNLHNMLYNSAFNLLNQKRSFEAKEVIPYFSAPSLATINELLLIATIALENNDYAASIQFYDRVLSKDPCLALARHNREIAQQHLDDIQQKEAEVALLHQQSSPSPPVEKLSKQPETPVTSKL